MTISIHQQWLNAKAIEAAAIKTRRDLEDQLIALYHFEPSTEGTKNYEADNYAIKIVGRIDRKVDADKLTELAQENGVIDHLSSLFRWKPEINMAVWKATDKSITDVLAEAITAKAGRPSFTITIKE